MPRHQLAEMKFPNGLRLHCLPRSRPETRFVYREIFEEKIYSRHGIEIHDGDCILDVGANIGMFVVFAMQRWKALRIYAFEPVPPIFAALQANVERLKSEYSGGDIQLFPFGVSSQAAVHEMTFFPQSPANSTRFPAEKQLDRESKAKALRVRDVWRYDKLGFLALLALYPFRHRLIQFRLGQLYAKGQRFRVEFKPLSRIIEEHNLSSVELLKVDVEGSEFDVLEGISDRHWDLIQQLVVELSPNNSARAKSLAEELAARGFQHIALESMGHEEYLEGSRLACNVYARR